MARILFTHGGAGTGAPSVLAHLTGCIMAHHNHEVRIDGVYRHELGIIVEVNDEAAQYLPTDCEANEALGTYRLPQEGLAHSRVELGQCPVCGHYGTDCTGTEAPHPKGCECDDCVWHIGTCSKCGQYVYNTDADTDNAIDVTARETGYEGCFDHKVCPGGAPAPEHPARRCDTCGYRHHEDACPEHTNGKAG